MAQRHHRVEEGCAAGWHQTCRQSREQRQRRDRKKSRRIDGRDSRPVLHYDHEENRFNVLLTTKTRETANDDAEDLYGLLSA
ncbi:MAG: hypothetical protein WBG35_06410, partial [Acidobacteriaceae bacterium]